MTTRKEKLLAHFEEGWPRVLEVSESWHERLFDLDDDLTKLIPDYKLYQVKEKWGTLRFYIDTVNMDKELLYQVDEKIAEAELYLAQQDKIV